MKRSRFSEEQIIGILKEHEAGVPVADLCRKNGTIYVGVTKDIRRRTFEHREGVGASFTKKYDVTKLVYFEAFDRVTDAINREKALKKWRRAWKVALIERDNADWKDLYFGLGLV